MKQIPILEKYSKVEFIKKKKKVILEFNDYIYFINVFDYIIKNGTSPLVLKRIKLKVLFLTKEQRI
jgi:hypothetical protein